MPKFLSRRISAVGITIVILCAFLVAGIALLAPRLYLEAPNKEEERIYNHTTANQEWIDLLSEADGFKIKFPAYPTHESDNLFNSYLDAFVDYDTYSIELDEMSYVIAVTKFPPDVDNSDPESMLEYGLNKAISSFQGLKLISSQFTSFDGHKAQDFLVYNEPYDTYIKGRSIMTEEALYELMVTYESQNYKENDFGRFITSFQLVQ